MADGTGSSGGGGCRRTARHVASIRPAARGAGRPAGKGKGRPAAAKGGTGQGKRRGGGNVRTWITSGGRTARAAKPARWSS